MHGLDCGIESTLECFLALRSSGFDCFSEQLIQMNGRRERKRSQGIFFMA